MKFSHGGANVSHKIIEMSRSLTLHEVAEHQQKMDGISF